MSDRCWFTSDTHFGHSNILQYSKRPFDDVSDMRESLIHNWNSVVQPGDRVYHLGDFALCNPEEATKIVQRLNGQRFLVFGNHDKALRKDAAFLSHWIWARDMAEIEVEGQKIILCHYALKTWNQSHRGSWNLYGHSHGSLKDDPGSKQIDVGVDCHDYYPISFEEVKKKMDKKVFVPSDHHGARPGGY